MKAKGENISKMSILKPQKMLFNNLIKTEELLEEIKKEDKVNNIIFNEADLTQAQFFKTTLKGVNLSSSIIEGIAVSIEDIKGATINQFQAIDLLYLLGEKVIY